ncbi:hypothetical protein CA850_10935 [Micromonospora echinospora]|uniref:WD40 repeat domain-containing protein n=1 Tax=Micromonospora echinospora TaxID=1877 RepID=A0A1C4ZQD0_MICEC|nr:WD40 repeat domain-containing protein [Micromonospora echinospora]OZV81669.1 hypothetical protein CA850_10935 [Micromonospora echinospora]SCF35006.1 hypothetical protein GA0070618_5581 [Micromonospora echinospora]
MTLTPLTRIICLAAVLLATGTACSADETPGESPRTATVQPPKDFRVTILSEPAGTAHSVAMSSDGKRAVTSSVQEDADPPHGSVSLWDLTDPLQPRASELIPDRGGTAVKVAMSGDGRYAATFHLSGKLTLWDLAHPARPMPRELAAEGVTSLALDHDGHHAISGGSDGVHLWDLTNPSQVRKKQLLGSGAYSVDYYEVAMSADAKRALVSHQSGNGDGGVLVYDLSNPASPAAYSLIRNAGYHSANTVALSGDGNIALVGYHHWTTYNNFLTRWDLRTWDKTELRPMTGWKIVPDTPGSVLRWEVALDQEGKRALIAQRHDPAAPGATDPPRSDVQLWALDTLADFPRFSPTN